MEKILETNSIITPNEEKSKQEGASEQGVLSQTKLNVL